MCKIQNDAYTVLKLTSAVDEDEVPLPRDSLIDDGMLWRRERTSIQCQGLYDFYSVAVVLVVLCRHAAITPQPSSRNARNFSTFTSSITTYPRGLGSQTTGVRAPQPEDAHIFKLPVEFLVQVAKGLRLEDLGRLPLACCDIFREATIAWKESHDIAKVNIVLDSDFPHNVGALAKHIEAGNTVTQVVLHLPRTGYYYFKSDIALGRRHNFNFHTKKDTFAGKLCGDNFMRAIQVLVALPQLARICLAYEEGASREFWVPAQTGEGRRTAARVHMHLSLKSAIRSIVEDGVIGFEEEEPCIYKIERIG